MYMKTIALYCGTFKPFHIGHLNIVEKAENIFGKGNVIIGIGINPEKIQEEDPQIRRKNIEDKIGRTVIVYEIFTHELIENYEKQGYKVVLIRGLRNGDDLAYEDNQLKFIRDFKKEINVVFFRCDEQYEHISSSAIRNLESFRKGSGSKYLI